MDYGYYLIIRVFICLSFLPIAYEYFDLEDFRVWVYTALVLLFQPFVRLELSREIWIVVDVLTILWITIDIVILYRKPIIYVLNGIIKLTRAFLGLAIMLTMLIVSIYLVYSFVDNMSSQEINIGRVMTVVKKQK